jgi:hypothetical protein
MHAIFDIRKSLVDKIKLAVNVRIVNTEFILYDIDGFYACQEEFLGKSTMYLSVQ